MSVQQEFRRILAQYPLQNGQPHVSRVCDDAYAYASQRQSLSLAPESMTKLFHRS